MKKFEMPEIEIEKFAMEDVITTSGGDDIIPEPSNENQLPLG